MSAFETPPARRPLQARVSAGHNRTPEDKRLRIPPTLAHTARCERLLEPLLGPVRDAKMAALFVVEKRAESAWRIKTRQTTPVDRAIRADQRCRMQVSN
jgi:hypothetical protein